MRCLTCNAHLSDYEATRRHAETQEFIDLCSKCLRIIEQDCEMPVVERDDLHHAEDEEIDDTLVIESDLSDVEVLEDVIYGTVENYSIDRLS